MKKRNREFLFEKEKICNFFQFFIFLSSDQCRKLRQWLDRLESVKWSNAKRWHESLMNWTITTFILAKLVGAGKNIFIFAGFLSILASLCNTHLPRLQIIICKNNHKLYLPLVYYSYSQVLPQSPFQWTIILCHNSAVCLFVILSQASQDILLQFFLLQTFDRIRLFWQSCLSNIQMFHNVKLWLIYKFIIVAFSLVQNHISKGGRNPHSKLNL